SHNSRHSARASPPSHIRSTCPRTPTPPSFFPLPPRPPTSTLFPYTTLFRSHGGRLRPSIPSSTRSPRRAILERSRKCFGRDSQRSEEHTSELQSPYDLVCRLLLEKKNKIERALDGPVAVLPVQRQRALLRDR